MFCLAFAREILNVACTREDATCIACDMEAMWYWQGSFVGDNVTGQLAIRAQLRNLIPGQSSRTPETPDTTCFHQIATLCQRPACRVFLRFLFVFSHFVWYDWRHFPGYLMSTLLIQNSCLILFSEPCGYFAHGFLGIVQVLSIMETCFLTHTVQNTVQIYVDVCLPTFRSQTISQAAISFESARSAHEPAPSELLPFLRIFDRSLKPLLWHLLSCFGVSSTIPTKVVANVSPQKTYARGLLLPFRESRSWCTHSQHSTG